MRVGPPRAVIAASGRVRVHGRACGCRGANRTLVVTGLAIRRSPPVPTRPFQRDAPMRRPRTATSRSYHCTCVGRRSAAIRNDFHSSKQALDGLTPPLSRRRRRASRRGPPTTVPRWSTARVVCYYLHRAQAVGDRLRQELSEVSAESLDGRSTLRAAATSLGEAARALEFANCRAVERGISRWPVFGRKLTTQLEELSCTLEDASKAADLRASAAFSRAVRNVLTQSIHRTQSVADQSSSPPARAQSSEIFSVQ